MKKKIYFQNYTLTRPKDFYEILKLLILIFYIILKLIT